MTPLRSPSATLAACLLAAGAQAAPVLVPSSQVPTELQLGEFEVYTLGVTNSGNQTATGVVLRMPLPAGLQPQAPVVPACQVVTEPLPGLGNNVRQLRCIVGSLTAQRSRSYSVVVQAPPLPMAGVSHRVRATATNANAAWSAQAQTTYQNYDVPVTPGLTWELRSCYGGTAPVAYSICPPSSEVVGDVILAAGGDITDTGGMVGPNHRWLQTNPHVLRLEWYPAGSPPGVTELSAINAKCLRGPGQTTNWSGQVLYVASRICRQ